MFGLIHFFTKYKYVWLAFFAIMLVVPCSVKRELKQHLNIETLSGNNAQSVTNCITSYLQESTTEAREKKQKQQFRESFTKKSYFSEVFIVFQDYQFSKIDDFDLFKEKIPTHIQNSQYLI